MSYFFKKLLMILAECVNTYIDKCLSVAKLDSAMEYFILIKIYV